MTAARILLGTTAGIEAVRLVRDADLGDIDDTTLDTEKTRNATGGEFTYLEDGVTKMRTELAPFFSATIPSQ